MTLATRTLGRTGIDLTTLGFGSMGPGNLYRPQSEDGAMAAVQAAYDGGHPLLRHRAALRLRPGRAPDGRRIAADEPDGASDALFDRPAPFKPRLDYSYDGVMRSFEDSLQRLGTDRVDILLLHDCDRRNHGGDGYRVRFREAVDGAAAALVSLREQDAVRAVGAGLNEWEACQDFAEACDFDCFLLAGRYTLLDQGALASFLPLCERRGIGVILGGPYNSGILATGPVAGALYDYVPAPPDVMQRTHAIAAACARHAVPLRAAALQFPLSHPAVVTVIPGARDAEEVTENLDLMTRGIPDALWQELRHEGLIP